MYFNFLDTPIGKGFFLMFLAVQVAETPGVGMVIIAIVVGCTAFVNIVIGCQQEKRPLPTPWDDNLAVD